MCDMGVIDPLLASSACQNGGTCVGGVFGNQLGLEEQWVKNYLRHSNIYLEFGTIFDLAIEWHPAHHVHGFDL